MNPLARRAAVGLALVWAACAAPEPDAPSVLLVTIDTLRADHLGVYGYPADVSPNVDALAARGALFERAIAASSRTAPSHASIMTSAWVAHHSIGHRNGSSRLDENEFTIAAAFARAGYRTAAFVSNSMLQRRVGLDLGFERYDDALSAAESNRPDVFERRADATTERALAWLDERPGDAFFAWVHYNDPHGPYTPPAAYADRFAPAAPPDETPLPVLHIDRGWWGIPAYQQLDGLRLLSQYRGRYAGEIRFFDDAFGRLLAAAERAARGRPLVVAVTSDHGESFGEEDFYLSHGHATTPELSRVPLLLVAPGIGPQRRAEPVHHVDIAPTLLELAGLAPPPHADGIALGPALRERAPLPERTLFCDVGAEVGAYRGDLYLRARLGSSLGDTRSGSWIPERWGADGVAPEPAALALRGDIERYAGDRVGMRDAAALSGDEAARLRALGYLGPGSADE